jgi:hypothetical protein
LLLLSLLGAMVGYRRRWAQRSASALGYEIQDTHIYLAHQLKSTNLIMDLSGLSLANSSLASNRFFSLPCKVQTDQESIDKNQEEAHGARIFAIVPMSSHQ